MIQTLGLFSELSGLLWRITTLAGVFSRSIKNMHKAFLPEFFFFNRCQICPLIAKFRCLKKQKLCISCIFCKRKGEVRRALFFSYLFFKLKAARYQQYLYGFRSQKDHHHQKRDWFQNKIHIFLLFRTVGFQSHL